MMDRSQLIPTLFDAPRALIGMLHVGPLAGSPLHRQTALDLDDQDAETDRGCGDGEGGGDGRLADSALPGDDDHS